MNTLRAQQLNQLQLTDPRLHLGARYKHKATGSIMVLDVVYDDGTEVILYRARKHQPKVALFWPVDEFLDAFEMLHVEPEPITNDLFMSTDGLYAAGAGMRRSGGGSA